MIHSVVFLEPLNLMRLGMISAAFWDVEILEDGGCR
jgi:hypothetical protein